MADDRLQRAEDGTPAEPLHGQGLQTIVGPHDRSWHSGTDGAGRAHEQSWVHEHAAPDPARAGWSDAGYTGRPDVLGAVSVSWVAACGLMPDETAADKVKLPGLVLRGRLQSFACMRPPFQPAAFPRLARLCTSVGENVLPCHRNRLHTGSLSVLPTCAATPYGIDFLCFSGFLNSFCDPPPAGGFLPA